MRTRVIRRRWSVVMALLLVCGLGVAVYLHQAGGASADKGKPSVVAAKVEKLHTKTASRTKEEDPDDLPPAVTPEKAMATAIQTVRVGKATLPAAARAAAEAATRGQNGPARGPRLNKIEHKQVRGSAVFAVVVDGVEVDVDRVTGTVVNIDAAHD